MSDLNLPSITTPFFGRDTELAQIRQWLADPTHRLISLIGMGGIGKTRLAIEAARQNADFFPDGVFFVRLQPLELPNLILPAIAEATRLIASPGVELIQQMAGFLGNKRRLLVLDSFEHLLSGVDVVIEMLLLAPEVKFLITSREKLNIHAEAVLHVDPLTYPEQEGVENVDHFAAIDLFLSLLHRLDPGLPTSSDVLADVSLICRQVEGLPLAIELAVGWAGTLPLKEIPQEIARSIDFLESHRRDSTDRHRNISAVLESSLQTLSEADRAIMEKLCVFRGSFTREAAEAVAGATLHSLALLINKSLVRHRSSGGYGIHELVRQYGEACLSSIPGQREAVKDRFRQYYAAFLENQWQEMKSAARNVDFEHLDAELANSLVAFQSMIENRNIAQIYQSMNALSGYFALRSRFNEGALIFGRSVEALRDSQDEPLIGSLLLRQAFFLACLGTPDIGDEAKRLADEGLRLLEHQQSAVPAEMLIVGYFCAGVVHWFSGKPEQMKDNAQISLDYAWEAEDPFGMLLAMSLLGRAEFKLGNYTRAKEIGSECYDLTIKQGNKWVQGFVTFSVLAEVAFVQQEYEEAQYWCQTSQRCFEGNAEPWNLATTLMLTVCAVALRDFDKAQKQLNTCLQLLEESGLVSQIPAMLLRVARLLASQQMTEYAGAILNLVIRHPACRKETYDEAMLLLNQLEAQLPAKRSATAWVFDQSLQLTQVFEPYTATAPQPGPASSLSERELDVLVLMAEGLSNAEIGQQLYVSVGTVKVHTRHIYDKLDVNSRTQAVARARKLGIL